MLGKATELFDQLWPGHNRRHASSCLFVILATATVAGYADTGAEIYKTTGPDGQVTYTNVSPEGTAPAAADRGDGLVRLVAPVALYPDDLLVIVLPASTYPLDIVKAQRFLDQVESNPDLQPDEAWDETVQALLNYPEVIKLMSDDLDWTTELGEAMVSQPEAVMEAVQQFRAQAQTAGNLETNEQQVVVQEKETIIIQPADPEVIYVPVYEPSQVVVYYGYPYSYRYYRYPPYWYRPAWFARGFFWGVGIGYGFSWRHRSIDVNINRNVRVNRGDINVRGGDRNVNVGDRGDRDGGRDRSTWRSEKRPGEVGRPGSGDRQRPAEGQRPGQGDRQRPADGQRPGQGDRQPSVGERPTQGAPTRPGTSDRTRPSTGEVARPGSADARRRDVAQTGDRSMRQGDNTFGGYKSGQDAYRNSNRGTQSRTQQAQGGQRRTQSGHRQSNNAFSGYSSGNRAAGNAARGGRSRGGGGGRRR